MTSPYSWNHTNFTKDSQPIIPYIYTQSSEEKEIPFGFQTVEIHVDATPSSSLNWELEKEKAHYWKEQGYTIFWNLNLGLFKDLKQPITDEGQWQGLEFTLKHFNKTLWEPFSDSSFGICLYETNSPFQGFSWNEELETTFNEELDSFPHLQPSREALIKEMSSPNLSNKSLTREEQLFVLYFCRNVCVDFLHLLVSNLEDSCLTFLKIDLSSWQLNLSMTEQAFLLSPDEFHSLNLIISPSFNQIPSISTQQTKASKGYLGHQTPLKQELSQPNVAVCLPQQDLTSCSELKLLDEAAKQLVKSNISFKFVTQTQLNLEWDELDYLVVSETSLTKKGKRMLAGFEAAGGTTLNLQQLEKIPSFKSEKSNAI
jgi:hypothetical protein